MTIFALATAPGKAGVAIIRISGPKAGEALTTLTGRPLPSPRYAQYARLTHPETQEMLDEAVALWFPGPHSFTGEDVVELQIHGSRAVISTLLQLLTTFPGLRLAEPGEFSRRAFMHGKMDLTRAEGLADLIDAETTLQAQQALRQLSGELQQLYDGWRSTLLSTLAFIEAYIDFPDEDLPPEVITEVTEGVNALKTAISLHINDKQRGEKLREGLYAVIIGAPNAGKSSLINMLAKRDVAIVSHIAGTTRDIIEVHLNMGGYPLIVADTAGLRESDDVIENEGIKRAVERANQADLKIALFEAGQEPDSATLALIDSNTVVAINKIDNNTPLADTINGIPAIPISLTHKIGLDSLLSTLEEHVSTRLTPSHDPVITHARYRQHLQACLKALDYFRLDKDIELAAEDLRMAARQIGRITGTIDVEQILDKIFSSFCIGK